VAGFDSAYLGVPPWDIGRPQSEVVRLEAEGAIRGTVLDCGCGTGENALFLAEHGHEVWGVDASARAIRKAEGKARGRSAAARFVNADALKLGALGRTFDSLIDCGLFHVFSDDDRVKYVRSLSAVSRSGTTLFLLCFSDRQPGSSGPRRITQEEIRKAFLEEWLVRSIQAAAFESNSGSDPIKAWLAQIVRA